MLWVPRQMEGKYIITTKHPGVTLILLSHHSHLNHQQSSADLYHWSMCLSCPALARTSHHHLSVNGYINLWLVSPLWLLALLLTIKYVTAWMIYLEFEPEHLLPTHDFPPCLTWSAQALPELTSASLFDQFLHGWSPHQLSSNPIGLLSMPSICQASSPVVVRSATCPNPLHSCPCVTLSPCV